MLSVIDDYPYYQFVIAGAPSQDFSFYKTFIKNSKVGFVDNKTHDLLSVSYAAVVTSGTATLETALFKIPEVVCYKGSWFSYQIGKRLVNLDCISLVNLIMDKEVVTELIQNEFNFCEGNVIKYISRYKRKNGIEDLKKAKQYIDFLIKKEVEKGTKE